MRTISQYAEFEEITQSDEPVVVKFFADWCPDCTRMNQWIDQLLMNTVNTIGIKLIVTKFLKQQLKMM